jgi:hypothetical protein
MAFQNTKTGVAINIQAENATWVQGTDATATIYSPVGSVYVGTGGTVVLIPSGANGTVNTGSATFINVPSGTILPVLAQRIMSTGTTATGFIILA